MGFTGVRQGFGLMARKGSVAAMAASVAVIGLLPAEVRAERISNPVAVFSGIDKITGRITTFDVYVNETVQFGALQVTPKVCYSRDESEAQKIDAFVAVDEITLDRKIRRIFSGWMFAASPALNAVEHPIYDVWLKECKAESDVPKPEGVKAAHPAPVPNAPPPQAQPQVEQATPEQLQQQQNQAQPGSQGQQPMDTPPAGQGQFGQGQFGGQGQLQGQGQGEMTVPPLGAPQEIEPTPDVQGMPPMEGMPQDGQPFPEGQPFPQGGQPYPQDQFPQGQFPGGQFPQGQPIPQQPIPGQPVPQQAPPGVGLY